MPVVLDSRNLDAWDEDFMPPLTFPRLNKGNDVSDVTIEITFEVCVKMQYYYTQRHENDTSHLSREVEKSVREMGDVIPESVRYETDSEKRLTVTARRAACYRAAGSSVHVAMQALASEMYSYWGIDVSTIRYRTITDG